QQVRLVWLVQMLVDRCQELSGPNCRAYTKNGQDYHNRVETVFTYYDDFRLTAFNVREDNGVDYALIYEDPAIDADRDNDSVLVPLSVGLQDVFLTARDCDSVVNGACVPDGRPDLTVAGRRIAGAPSLASRVDREQNNNASLTHRWGLAG